MTLIPKGAIKLRLPIEEFEYPNFEYVSHPREKEGVGKGEGRTIPETNVNLNIQVKWIGQFVGARN